MSSEKPQDEATALREYGLRCGRRIRDAILRHVNPQRPDKFDEFFLAAIVASVELPEQEMVAIGLLREFFKLLDDGVLVRDISRDNEPGWAIRQYPLVSLLARTNAILDAAPPPAGAQRGEEL